MPIYDLQLRDGRTVPVEAPAGATLDELIDLANQQAATPQAQAQRRRASAEAIREEMRRQFERNTEESKKRRARDTEEAGALENILSGFWCRCCGAGGSIRPRRCGHT